MGIVFSTYIDRLDSKKKHSSFRTSSGSSTIPTYEYQVVDGIKQLVQIGEHDLDAEIQSHAMEADIHCILTQFLNGDSSVLNKAVGQFGDFTNYPTTYAELFDRVQKCKNLFEGLPSDIKVKFDNSYQKFWSDFGSDHFNDIFEEFNSANDSVADSSADVNGGVVDAE